MQSNNMHKVSGLLFLLKIPIHNSFCQGGDAVKSLFLINWLSYPLSFGLKVRNTRENKLFSVDRKENLTPAEFSYFML